MPPEGEDAASHVQRKYGISAEQSRANSGKMAAVAAELGFAFNRGPGFRMRNSFDAHRLLSWSGALAEARQAIATGVRTYLKLALFGAPSSTNPHRTDHSVLTGIAQSVGAHDAPGG